MGEVHGGTSVAGGRRPRATIDNSLIKRIGSGRKKLERVMGIEPTFEAWEAPVLPLNYTRINLYSLRYPS